MSNTKRNTTSAAAQVCQRCLELTTRLVAVEHELYEAKKRVLKRPVRCEGPLPCPFCGGLAISEVYVADGETYAVCNDCGATGPDSGHDDAIANWDRRTPDNA